MPRQRATSNVLEDQALPGLDDLPADPAPKATRGRPRKATTAAKPATGARRGRPPGSGANRVMSKAAMQAKVSSEIYAYVSMAAAGWELRDPECAGVLYETVVIPGASGPVQVERLQAIVDRIVAMISRNDDLLKRFSDSGILGELAVLGTLVFPLARAAFRAHGPGGTGHDQAAGGHGGIDTAQYPAYSGANGR